MLLITRDLLPSQPSRPLIEQLINRVQAMGNWLSACCRGEPARSDTASELLLITLEGRPKDGLYEPALAETEREAVADLLQYLENVIHPGCRCKKTTHNSIERRNRLLQRPTTTRSQYTGIL